MPADIALQTDIAFRLLVAAFLGALIGLEREIHEHPAGMRTHLLVSLGSAIFTVVSIHGFGGPAAGLDPSRVAAQIVSGIGFLGAGAIIKYGTSIRGLTTAASLWATAAVGLAVGANAYIVGIVGTAIVVVSLWPLHILVGRIGLGPGRVRIRLHLERLEALGAVTHELATRRVEILGMQTERRHKTFEVELELRPAVGTKTADVLQALGSLPGVEILETIQEAD
ncbi:MAG TPA: MgtC/SapB family protein [Candidatus Limnocylindrales bacterium]